MKRIKKLRMIHEHPYDEFYEFVSFISKINLIINRLNEESNAREIRQNLIDDLNRINCGQCEIVEPRPDKEIGDKVKDLENAVLFWFENEGIIPMFAHQNIIANGEFAKYLKEHLSKPDKCEHRWKLNNGTGKCLKCNERWEVPPKPDKLQDRKVLQQIFDILWKHFED